MPKRISRRPMDVNQAAFQMVQRSTAEREPEKSATKPFKPTKSEISRFMAEMGRKGGKIGGKRRLQTMTPEARRAIASRAGRARWSKRNKP